MRMDTGQLFWRSRPDNPVNDFYLAEADGCLKGDRWNVFWYGLEGLAQAHAAVSHCRARAATLTH